jgi:hypothetical protein
MKFGRHCLRLIFKRDEYAYEQNRSYEDLAVFTQMSYNPFGL